MSTSTILEHRKFICVEFGETNNNKFWNITLFDNDDVQVEWGRVGKNPQSKIHYGTGRNKFDSLIREKTKLSNSPDKRYTEVKAVDCQSSSSPKTIVSSQLKDIAKKQIRTKSKLVQDLIDFLIKVNAHNVLQATGGRIQYDASNATFTTPMGVISPDQVKDARSILNEMARIQVSKKYNGDKLNQELNKYLRLIPHDVGMRKISFDLILPDSSSFQKENDLLDGLEASFDDAVKVVDNDGKTQDSTPEVFNVEMEIVDDNKIISWAKNMYQSTRKDMHLSNNLSVQTVYKVSIKTMADAFEKYGKKVGNILQLWHGTKASNLLSILKKGLIIPPSSSAHCTGRMFGDGLYFSDISTKALNYATGYWGHGGNMDRTFMFLADVAMGKSYIPRGYYESLPKSGFDSTFARSGSSGVANNEMIVYRTHQANLIYLIEFVPRQRGY